MSQARNESNDRLMRFPEVSRISGLSRSSIWRHEQQGRFPRRIKLSGGAVIAWRESDLREWLADPAGYQAQESEE